MVVERSAVDPRSVRVAVHRHVRLQVALRQIGHGERGLRRCRHRVLAPFDAVDDGNRLFARLLDGELAMPAEGNALRSARSAALHHIDLAPGRIDADSEAGQFAIPEDRVPSLDGQPVDGSFGDCELGSSWHRIPVRFSLPIAVFSIVSTTEAIGIKRVRIGARVWRGVNGSEKKASY